MILLKDSLYANVFDSMHRTINKRQPVTLDLLCKLTHVTSYVRSSQFEAILFSAVFSLAFFGFVRIGELVQSGSESVHITNQGHSLRVWDVNIDRKGAFHISLRSSKTDQKVEEIAIHLLPTYSPMCPVYPLRKYLIIRPSSASTNLLVHLNGSPLACLVSLVLF